MTTEKALRRGSLPCKLTTLAAAMMSAACVFDATAAFERTIEAPGGVGDVVALTNALAEYNALASDDARNNARILLKPGTYNLAGVYMNSLFHLNLAKSTTGGIFAGLGEGPSETVLLGGGEAGAHGVIRAMGSGNWGIFTVSNLTVTGGWTLNDGGGIRGESNVEYRNLIVSNNYAKGSDNGTGGGGCFLGRAFDCLFENNRTDRWGGGFNVQGRCAMHGNEGQGAWRCTFRNNSAVQYGGAFAIRGGQCIGCKFWGNSTSGVCADVYVYELSYTTQDGSPRTTHVTDCTFVGGLGSAVGYSTTAVVRVPVTNCTFRANRRMGNYGVVYGCDMKDCVMEFNTNEYCIAAANTMESCKIRSNRGQAVWKSDMKNCIIEANTSANQIISNCNMDRCVVKNNVATGNESGIDTCSEYGSRTNVNCLIEANRYSAAYGPILKNKVLVNCTIVGNDAANDNWGRPIETCALWNCVLFGNKLGQTFRDVRTKTLSGGAYSMTLTDCVFVSSDLPASDIGASGVVTHDGFGNCCQVLKAALKLVDEPNGDYTPTTRSPLYGTGCADDWIIELVGDKDLVGNQRVFGGGLDIGAYESQLNKPGLMLIVW